jgi:hypothetical protein
MENASNIKTKRYSCPLIYANRAKNIRIRDASFIFNWIFETLQRVIKIKNIMPMQNIDMIILYILPFIFILNYKKKNK